MNICICTVSSGMGKLNSIMEHQWLKKTKKLCTTNMNSVSSQMKNKSMIANILALSIIKKKKKGLLQCRQMKTTRQRTEEEKQCFLGKTKQKTHV